MRVEDEAVRLTFEDTLNRQRELRRRLELWIKEKRPIKPQEREWYFETLYKALLTIGRGQKIYYPLPDGTNIPLGSLIYFAEKMAYQKKSIVKLKYNYKVYEIPIEKIWKLLLDHFLQLFPHALWEAIHLSPERFRYKSKPEAVEYKPSLRYGGAERVE